MHLKPWGFRPKHCGPERWPDPRLSGVYSGREMAWKETQRLLFNSSITLLSATSMLLSHVHLPVLPAALGWQSWSCVAVLGPPAAARGWCSHIPHPTSPSWSVHSTLQMWDRAHHLHPLGFGGGCGGVWFEFLGCFALFFLNWWMSSYLCCNYGGQLNIYSLALPRQTCIMSALIRAYMCIVCGVMRSWSTWGTPVSCCNVNDNRYSWYTRFRKDLCLWKIRIFAAPVQRINDPCNLCPQFPINLFLLMFLLHISKTDKKTWEYH